MKDLIALKSSGSWELTTNINGQDFAMPKLVFTYGKAGVEQFNNWLFGDIENKNTRAAYMRAWIRFSNWLEKPVDADTGQRLMLMSSRTDELQPLDIRKYLDWLSLSMADTSVKQHRAALAKGFDYLLSRGIRIENPVTPVKGPKVRQEKGLTPYLEDEEFLDLIESINTDTLAGLRDKALISALVYTWGRISAVLNLKMSDYSQEGKRWHIRVKEKGNKNAKLAIHQKAEDALDAYIAKVGLTPESKEYIFCSFNRKRQITKRQLDRREALAMIKRRAKKAGIPNWRNISPHSFRATGITNYMNNGGRREVAQEWANHADGRTTALYDHQKDRVTKEEIDRMRFERDRSVGLLS